MVATRTTVAHSMPVVNGMPLAAIGAREEVPPCCATVLGAYACRQVAACANLWVPLFSRTAWSQRKLRVAVHSPQCEECTAMLGFSWFPAVREKRYTQDCAHAKGSFRTICSDGYSTGGATSQVGGLTFVNLL